MNARSGAVRRWAWVALVAGAAAGCAVNPVTGERQLSLVSVSQEIQIGRQAAQETAQSLGLVEDSTLQAYVQRLGAQLAARTERPELPWTFRVVESPTPNAFALPGGFIFVTRGMMNLMDSEAELASVLGHEIGHVTARHSATAISRQQLAQLGLGVGTVLFPDLQQFGGLAGSGLQLLFLKYGRDAERQADDLGFRYAEQTGYDVREMGKVFAALQRIGEAEGASSVPSWLATHPEPADRIRAVEERLATAPPPANARLGRAEYLARIDGLVYGENPRNGFFREGVFFHPELRFQLRFPQGWPTQNLPQAVAAVGPQRDASLQLTLAGGSPEQAAQQFLAKQGIESRGASRETINGLPAVVSQFAAQSQAGAIRGWIAFISYRGQTYQLLAYAAAPRFGQYDRLFQQVLGSFAPLTDERILAVQPARIDVVRLERAMTLAEFNRQYPSAIPLQELAILNQVDGASSRLAAGASVKRVVQGA